MTKTGNNYFEIANTKLSVQDGLCWFENGEMQGCLVNKIEGTKVFPNKTPLPKTGTLIYRNQDSAFEKQLKISKTKRRIRVDFAFEHNKLTAADEDGNIVSLPVNSSETPNNP